MDHCRNHGAHSGDACPDLAGALYTLADIDTAHCVLVAEDLLSAAGPHAAADPDSDDTESDAAAVP